MRFLTPTLLLSAALCTGACSVLEPGGVEIRVQNRTESSILFLAWELQESHLIDLAPSIELSALDPRVLPPGALRALLPEDVSGGFEAGDHLRIFLYEVTGEIAEYRTALTLSPGDLRATGYRIRIRSLAP
jgi:hypothetical protein